MYMYYATDHKYVKAISVSTLKNIVGEKGYYLNSRVRPAQPFGLKKLSLLMAERLKPDLKEGERGKNFVTN